MCVIEGGGRGSRHSISECQQEGASEVRKQWGEMAKGMRPGDGKAGKFAPYSCCFKCYVPQAICQSWQSQEGQQGKWRPTGRSCQFKDIIMPVVVCMLCQRGGWAEEDFENWATADGVNIREQEEVLRWLGQKIIWGDIEVSRLVQIFYRFEKGRELRGGEGGYRI